MNRHYDRMHMILFFGMGFLLLFGCSESGVFNGIETYEESDREIIFGNRSNDNIAHIAWEAESASSSIQNKQWQQITTARNSALFWNETTYQRPGSMVAASAGQYLTAHHVIDAILDSNNEMTGYKIRFPEGWRFDIANPGNYLDSNGNHLLASEYYIKNSWYLRYRLKSLGLNKDATDPFSESIWGVSFYTV